MSGFRRVTRRDRERHEDKWLAPAATRSSASRGRRTAEEPDTYRTVFERDRDRILHSKAFRRLKHKTQVFINPEGDHYVTRLTHTLAVTQVGRGIAAALGLNETLTEAICLAHDVGHSPFGHTGEDAISEFLGTEWLHSAHGVRVFEELEPLNLTWEVRDGIRAHSWKIAEPPHTPEGWVCRFADRIAYLAHDAEDALRAGVLEVSDLPQASLATFGDHPQEWIGTMISAVVEESRLQGHVTMQPAALEAMHELRSFLFANVYLRPQSEPERTRATRVVHDLLEHFAQRPAELPEGFDTGDVTDNVVDYVAGMTDRFAIRLHEQLASAL